MASMTHLGCCFPIKVSSRGSRLYLDGSECWVSWKAHSLLSPHKLGMYCAHPHRNSVPLHPTTPNPWLQNASRTLKTEAKYLLRNQLSSKAKINLSYRGNESQMRKALMLRYSEFTDATWGAKGDT